MTKDEIQQRLHDIDFEIAVLQSERIALLRELHGRIIDMPLQNTGMTLGLAGDINKGMGQVIKHRDGGITIGDLLKFYHARGREIFLTFPNFGLERLKRMEDFLRSKGLIDG